MEQIESVYHFEENKKVQHNQEYIEYMEDTDIKQEYIEYPNPEIKLEDTDEDTATVEEDVAGETENKETVEDYESKKRSLNKKRERKPQNHISDKSRKCQVCGKLFSTIGYMLTHYRSKHEGIKYPCTQCDYRATQQGDLQKHIQSKHEGIKYPCNQCDYQATTQSNLQIHIQSIHEGIMYPCSHCDYQATTRGNLQKHIRSSHA